MKVAWIVWTGTLLTSAIAGPLPQQFDIEKSALEGVPAGHVVTSILSAQPVSHVSSKSLGNEQINLNDILNQITSTGGAVVSSVPANLNPSPPSSSVTNRQGILFGGDDDQFPFLNSAESDFGSFEDDGLRIVNNGPGFISPGVTFGGSDLGGSAGLQSFGIGPASGAGGAGGSSGVPLPAFGGASGSPGGGGFGFGGANAGSPTIASGNPGFSDGNAGFGGANVNVGIPLPATSVQGSTGLSSGGNAGFGGANVNVGIPLPTTSVQGSTGLSSGGPTVIGGHGISISGPTSTVGGTGFGRPAITPANIGVVSGGVGLPIGEESLFVFNDGGSTEIDSSDIVFVEPIDGNRDAGLGFDLANGGYLPPTRGDAAKPVASSPAKPSLFGQAKQSNSKPQIFSKTLGSDALSSLLSGLTNKAINPTQTLGNLLRGLNGQNGIVVVDLDDDDIDPRDSFDDLDAISISSESEEIDTVRIAAGGDTGSALFGGGLGLKSLAGGTKTLSKGADLIADLKRPLAPKFLFESPLIEILSTKGQWLGTLIGGLVDIGDTVVQGFSKDKPF